MLPRMTNVKACRHEGAAFTSRLGSNSEASAPTALDGVSLGRSLSSQHTAADCPGGISQLRQATFGDDFDGRHLGHPGQIDGSDDLLADMNRHRNGVAAVVDAAARLS